MPHLHYTTASVSVSRLTVFPVDKSKIMPKQKTKIPEGWRKTRLGDITEITNGKTNTQDAVPNGEYPLFDRSTEIKRSSKFLFDEEAIILPGEGAEFVPRYFSGKFDLHQRAYIILPDKNKATVKFLYYYIFALRKILAKNAVGSTVKSLRLPIIQAMPVLLPPLATQNKIAEILWAIDEEIEKVERVIEKSEKIKDGILKTIFVTKNKNNEVLLKNITRNIQYGYTASATNNETGVKFLRITDISSRHVDWQIVPNCEIQNDDVGKYKLCNGDIVFARTGATTGCSYYIVNPPVAVFASYLIRLQSKNDLVWSKFLYYFFQSDNYWRQINTGISGSAQGGFNATKLSNLKLSMPATLSEQKKFSDILSTVDGKISIYKKIKNNLTQLKKGLMGDLLGGKKIL